MHYLAVQGESSTFTDRDEDNPIEVTYLFITYRNKYLAAIFVSIHMKDKSLLPHNLKISGPAYNPYLWPPISTHTAPPTIITNYNTNVVITNAHQLILSSHAELNLTMFSLGALL
ncbi:uncharacterized protein EAE97_003776 [Botrytis byssoidea]|uniref:Uncharacterized protein n=1 Tax=Botrytis byssoidea TaxID=139641 RepID=A0A9P5INN8_9HELO|nr:uncharacterized protein EAE97_003776 [Botrytis byssoidea]KAF7948365.1 hypothetical protein EAE97_003776 [Botrytis byssoidea]